MTVILKPLNFSSHIKCFPIGWQRHNGCHSVSFVMYISSAKSEEHHSKIYGVQGIQTLIVLKRRTLRY